MNQQPIEKRDHREDGLLDVYNIFGPTIQGEGPFTGQRCIFVRLAGCNLQCPGCDTEYSDQAKRRWMTPAEISNRALELAGTMYTNDYFRQAHGSNEIERILVVVSGGEPFRQNLGPLFEELTNYFSYVQVETNGTLEPTPYNDHEQWAYNTDVSERRGVYVVCSPKTPKVHPKFDTIACAYKYVLSYDSVDADGLPGQVLDTPHGASVARPGPEFKGPIYLNPMDHSMSEPYGKRDWCNKKSIEAVKASCIKYGYILGVQLHKIIGVE